MEMIRSMLVITSYDWYGTPEGLKEFNEAWKKFCKETPCVKSTKLYTSHQARYHYAWITETDSYDKFVEAYFKKMPPRDRRELAHTINEIFSEV